MKNKGRLKLLIFSTGGAGTHYYGPGMSAYRLYKELKPEVEIDLYLAHGYQGQEELPLFKEQYYISGINNKNPFSLLKFLFKAKRWISKNGHRFDVVHTLSSFHASFMFSLWMEKRGIPVFMKIAQYAHTGFENSSKASKLLGLSRFRRKNADKITGYIAISSDIEKKLIETGIDSSRIHRIPNGVNTERFKPLPSTGKKRLREKMGLQDQFTVLFTGGFSNRKNPLLILEAMAGFLEASEMQLLLVGPDRDDGTQRSKIKEIIDERSLSNVYLYEFSDNIEVYYQSSDLFVLPSKDEGLSNSLLEAMACGLPAIVTDISGSNDLVTNGVNGTFICRNKESIRNAIQAYFMNPEKVMNESIQARLTVEKGYTSERVLNQHLHLFRSMK